MSTWVAALIAVAAVAVTYFSCVRPMLRGRGHCGMSSGKPDQNAELEREIADLREELRLLRADDAASGGETSGAAPARRTEA